MSKINLDEFFISCLGSVEDLKWELDNDVNLLECADKKILALIGIFFVLIPKSTKEEIFGEVTSETILDLLKRERPDFFGIIANHPRGRVWVEKNIENFKGRFLK